MASQPLIFTQTVAAAPEVIYQAFTSGGALQEWLAQDARAEPRLGGRLYLWWESEYYAMGHFTELIPGQRLAFTWQGRGEPSASTVSVSLAPQEEGTCVTVTHAELGEGEAWERCAAEIGRKWAEGLENLQSILESGEDLRLTRRPMFGLVHADELNEERAAALGVPVTQGIWLGELVEGMGPHQAGLQRDDVLVWLGDREITGWASFGQVISSHRAGDELEVRYYRDADLHQTRITLSSRPPLEVPPTPEALAEALREVYRTLDGERMELLEGVSAEEAVRQPAPGEWSVREVLAHLIVTERAAHQIMGLTIAGNGGEQWDTNIQIRLDALLAVYPTVAELVAESRRCERESVEILARFSPEFLARKGSYRQLGTMMLHGLPIHTRMHFNQMREAITAARR